MVGFGVVLALLVAESAVRLAERFDPELAAHLEQHANPIVGLPFDSFSAHPFLPFTGAPNVRYRSFSSEGDRVVQLDVVNNSHGFRAHEFPATKRPNDYFVLCLGGSTTWGASSPTNDTTWPELLERQLAETYPDKNVKVFNFGVTAATTAYSVVSLSLIGIHLRPDLVIVYHGMNDPFSVLSPEYRSDSAHYYKDFDPETAWRGYRRSLPTWTLASHALVLLTTRWDTALNVSGLYYYITHPAPPSRAVTPPESTARMAANLRTLHDIATGAGAEVLFSTFQFRDPVTCQFPLNEELRAFYEEEGFAYVDQDALIPDFDRSINYDQCHFTLKGRRILAENFHDAIIERGLVKFLNERRG